MSSFLIKAFSPQIGQKIKFFKNISLSFRVQIGSKMGGKNYKVVEPKLDQKLDVAEKFEVWVGL